MHAELGEEARAAIRDAMDVMPDGRGTAAWNGNAESLDRLPAHAAAAVAIGLAGRAAAALVTWISGALARWRQRVDLSELDNHLLKDIGVSRSAARAEAAKPFWMFSSPS